MPITLLCSKCARDVRAFILEKGIDAPYYFVLATNKEQPIYCLHCFMKSTIPHTAFKKELIPRWSNYES